MSMIEINWNPTRKDLRIFGIGAFVASMIISAVLYFLKGIELQWISILIAAGFVIFLSSVISAKVTRMIYVGLSLVTLPIGWVLSFIMLAVFYYLIVTPIGLVFRLTGRDPLNRKFDSNAKSYWKKRKSPDTLDRYFHQF
jgi:hypothetical protein